VSEAADGTSRPAGQPQPARTSGDAAEILPVDDGAYAIAEPELVVVEQGTAETPRGAAVLPQPSPAPGKSAAAMMRQAEELLKPVDKFFANPAFYRIVGYVSAVLALLIFAVSLPLSIWGRSWFTGALLFALVFLVAEAAAALLAALRRIESR
jgi:hypothetical protein